MPIPEVTILITKAPSLLLPLAITKITVNIKNQHSSHSLEKPQCYSNNDSICPPDPTIGHQMSGVA